MPVEDGVVDQLLVVVQLPLVPVPCHVVSVPPIAGDDVNTVDTTAVHASATAAFEVRRAIEKGFMAL